MEPKLILIEGLPGSGKSTFARFLSIQFERNGFRSFLFHESTFNHPIIGSNLNEDAFLWQEGYINNWVSFLNRPYEANSVIIMESALMQNPIIELLHKDAERSHMISLIGDVSRMIKGRYSQSSLIFFEQSDANDAINHMIESRGGTELLTRKYEQYQNEKYYVNRNRLGPELHIQFLMEYAHIASSAVRKVNIETLTINNTAHEWSKYERQLVDYYGLQNVPDPIVSLDELSRYVGEYYNKMLNLTIAIELQEGSLYIFGNRKLRTRRGKVFYLDDISVQITFFEEEGKCHRLLIDEQDIFVNRNEEGTFFENKSFICEKSG
jgi:hypothetical protein